MSSIRKSIVKSESYVHIWTDGSCNNSLNGKDQKGGNGGYGVVMVFNSSFRHQFYGGSFQNTTSARMELRGVIEALKRVTPNYKVTIYCDNQYVVNSVRNGWVFNWKANGELNRRANGDLWKEFLQLYNQFPKDAVQLCWVKGHNGNVNNELADKLASRGAKSNFKIIDLCQEDLKESQSAA